MAQGAANLAFSVGFSAVGIVMITMGDGQGLERRNNLGIGLGDFDKAAPREHQS